MTRLKLSAVSKAYGATQAVRQADLSIAPGEIHVLMGPNGSGKSTLCKIVAGSIRPDSGQVILDGQPVRVSGPKASLELGIGVFYQELSLADNRSVAENICLSALPVRLGFLVDRRAVRQRAAALIERFASVCGTGFTADTLVGSLRADQKQLVEIMKTLATEAPVLIFDEPTSALDRAQVECFFSVLRELRAQGRSIVFISHRMDEIFQIGDQVSVIRDGTVVATQALAALDQPALVKLLVGDQAITTSNATELPTSSAYDQGEQVLSVQALTGPDFARISLHLNRGEILGFAGLHGQGQSAVLRALFGLTAVQDGSVYLAGQPLTPEDPRSAIKAGLAYVSGDRRHDGIIPGRSIIENVIPVHAFRAGLYLARPGALAKIAIKALKALKTKFAGFAHSIESLSGGNQQKVVIARWLIDRPTVFLLDDPTKGIDLAAKADLYRELRALARSGAGLILYSSEDAEVLDNADRILVFNNGTITRELTGLQRNRVNLYEAAFQPGAQVS